MKVRDLIVKMNSVSPSVIPHALNLGLQALEPVRLVGDTVSQAPHDVSEGIQLGDQVVESHV